MGDNVKHISAIYEEKKNYEKLKHAYVSVNKSATIKNVIMQKMWGPFQHSGREFFLIYVEAVQTHANFFFLFWDDIGTVGEGDTFTLNHC